MSTLISIIMPVRNAGRFIEDCLNSILNQDLNSWELIAVNDHSTDNSLDLLKDYQSKDSRVKCFHNSGKGIIDALRVAFENSEGSFITRMDADDIMQPNRLSALSSALHSESLPSVSTGLVRYFSDKELGDGYKKYEEWLNNLTRRSANFDEIYKECVIPSPCWMLKRETLIEIGAFESDCYPEDYDLCFRMYEAGLHVQGVNLLLHLWRDYGERTSRNDANYADNRFLELKLDYFLKLDYEPSKKLFVWGAGKKGKEVAKYLNKNDISFDWYCDNPKKIGKDIYGVKMKDVKAIMSENDFQCILLVANLSAQEIIKKDISTSNTDNQDFYWFC